MIDKREEKAVIYCRVSTEEQAKEGESLDHQERLCINFAEQHKYKVVEKYIERGASGRTSNRPQMKKMLNYVSDHRIPYIICLKIDRFMRNSVEYACLTQYLSKKGTKVLFVEGTNEDDASGRLLKGISAQFAEFESNVNSERTKAGICEAFLHGRWLWRLRGYSFRLNSQNQKQLYPNEEAEHVKKIFALADKGVYTQLEILQTMKKDGFVISKQALSVLLRNSVYCGLLPDTYKRNNGNYIKGIHEPLISEETFFRVQQILDGKRPNAVPRVKNNPDFPLRGYIYCEKCGRRLTACFAKGKVIKVPYYQCYNKGCPRYQKKVLESSWVEYLKELKPNEEILVLFEKEIVAKFKEKTKEDMKQDKQVNNTIANLQDKKSKLIDLMTRNILSYQDGKIEIDKINQEISYYEETKNINADKRPNLEECLNFSKNILINLDTAWVNGDLDFRQRLQGLIIPEGFKFDGKFIKPIKNPHFMRVFSQKTGNSQIWGG